MPQRFIQRCLNFSVQELFGRFLSTQPGWSTGSAEDIINIIWETLPTRRLTVVRQVEPNLKRYIIFSSTEIYTLVSAAPGWGGATEAIIESILWDPAARIITIFRVPEAA